VKHVSKVITAIKHCDGVKLTADGIAAFARISREELREAIQWTMRQQLVYRHKGQYRVTTLGDEWLEDQGLADKQMKSLYVWKDEALSGVRCIRSRRTGFLVSRESTIDHAVISTSTIEGVEGIRPDELVMQMDSIRKAHIRVRSILGLPMSTYQKYLEEGRVRVCRSGDPHVGVFDRRGKGWQNRCRECRKKRRGKLR